MFYGFFRSSRQEARLLSPTQYYSQNMAFGVSVKPKNIRNTIGSMYFRSAGDIAVIIDIGRLSIDKF